MHDVDTGIAFHTDAERHCAVTHIRGRRSLLSARLVQRSLRGADSVAPRMTVM